MKILGLIECHLGRERKGKGELGGGREGGWGEKGELTYVVEAKASDKEGEDGGEEENK